MLVGLGLIVVIALFTALIAPYFIDWTAYKKDFEEQASRIIGQRVNVGGTANVRILPLPSISFTDLSVGENADGQPMMTVGKFQANVELMPFLSGEIRVVDMSLDSPVFDFNIEENGQIAWTKRQQALVDPDQVKLDKLTVTNAAFNLTGVGPDKVIRGRGINADVSAVSLFGPWRIAGSGDLDGQASKFELATGRLSDENSIRLKANLRRNDKPYTLGADGTVSLQDEVLSWVGKFEVNPAGSLGEAGANLNAPLPVRIKGDFSLTPNELELPAYSIDIGSQDDPFSLSGQGIAGLKGGVKFKLQIDGRQVDFDRIAKMREGETAKANTLETRINLFRDVLAQIPVPPYEGEIDLEIPAIIAGDTFIREVSALIRPFGEGWEIVRLKSSLPGNTHFEASGRLGVGDNFGFHGDLLVASRQPSGFAAWAAGKVDPAIRRLGSAGLSANVALTPGHISLDQMELLLDQNRLEGKVQRLAPASPQEGKNPENPAIVANLKGDSVKLEDLRAIASLFAGEQSVSLENDFDITLKADTLSAFDLDAKNVDLQFQYKKGALSIARFNLDNLLGTSVRSTGQVTNFLDKPRGNMSLDVSADTLERAAKYVGDRFGWNAPLRALAGDASLSTDTSLRLEFDFRPGGASSGSAGNGDAQNRVLMEGNIAKTRLSLQSAIKGDLKDLKSSRFDLSLDADGRNGATLLQQLGMADYGFDPAQGEMDAPIKLAVEGAGSLNDGFSTTISLNNDRTAFSANGSMRGIFSDEPIDEYDVTLGSSDIVPLVYSFGYLLPGMNPIFGDVAPFSSKFKVKSSSEIPLTLELEKGQISGNGFSGSLKLEEISPGNRKWSGNLDVDRLSVDVLSGLATNQAFKDELGDWSQAGFSSRPFADQTGALEVSANAADIGYGEDAHNMKFKVRGDKDEVSFADISFDWAGSKISGNINLNQGDGSLFLNSQFLASNLNAGQVLKEYSIAPVLMGTGEISVTIDGNGKTPEALVGSLSGNGVAAMKEGRLLGVNTTGLDSVLTGADEDGFEINTKNVKPLAKAAFLSGETGFGDVSAPFSISKGVIGFKNINLQQNENTTSRALSGDAAFDLTNGELSADLKLKADAGDESVAGGSPEVTFIWKGAVSAPELDVDTRALEGFLSIRAFEIEQRRVETLQASILEKQRFRYEMLKSNERSRWLEEKRLERERAAAAEAARLAKLEEERKAAAEAARLAAEAAEKARLEELQRKEAERIAKAEEAKRLAAEEKKRKEAELKKLKEAELAAARKAAEDEAERKAVEAERRAAEAAAREKLKQQQAAEADKQNKSKSGFDVKPLPAPEGAEKVQGLFKNIEKLLFQ